MAFYHSAVAEESWALLQELRRKYEFVLIGGWAVWLYTKSLKSKDIDIIVDYEGLARLKKDLFIAKNDRLRKYEYRRGSTDVDIYVPHYSQLGIPLEQVVEGAREIGGFTVAKPEHLLVLKQKAAIGREGSMKGEKDRIDIASLLASSVVDLRLYSKICRENGLEDLLRHLKRFVQSAGREFAAAGLSDPRKVRLLKERVLQALEAP